MDSEFLVDGTSHRVALETREEKTIAMIDGRRFELDIQQVRPGVVSLLLEGRSFLAYVARQGGRIFVSVESGQFCLEELSQDSSVARAQGGGLDETDGKIRAPMPGMVSQVNVEEGSEVRKGDGLIVVEAMKMEHEMRAPFDAVVERVHVRSGQQVDAFQPLVELRPNPSG